MTEFITRNHGQKEFEVIIKTDNKDHYKATEDFARKLIDHAKPQTNADRIRAMSDEELAEWLEGVDCFYCHTCAYQQECRFEKDTETVNYSEKYSCKEGRTKWLKQPAEEDTE